MSPGAGAPRLRGDATKASTSGRPNTADPMFYEEAVKEGTRC